MEELKKSIIEAVKYQSCFGNTNEITQEGIATNCYLIAIKHTENELNNFKKLNKANVISSFNHDIINKIKNSESDAEARKYFIRFIENCL